MWILYAEDDPTVVPGGTCNQNQFYQRGWFEIKVSLNVSVPFMERKSCSMMLLIYRFYDINIIIR